MPDAETTAQMSYVAEITAQMSYVTETTAQMSYVTEITAQMSYVRHKLVHKCRMCGNYDVCDLNLQILQSDSERYLTAYSSYVHTTFIRL